MNEYDIAAILADLRGPRPGNGQAPTWKSSDDAMRAADAASSIGRMPVGKAITETLGDYARSFWDAVSTVGSAPLFGPSIHPDSKTPEMRDKEMSTASTALAAALVAGSMPRVTGRAADGMLHQRVDMAYPPTTAKRPFENDYVGTRGIGPQGSPLPVDIDGRPLVAKYVAGRRTFGGDDIGLTPRETLDVARMVANDVAAVDPKALGGDAVSGGYHTVGNTISINNTLSPQDTALTLAHELGHAIDYNAKKRIFGPRKPSIDPMPHEAEARRVYAEGHSPSHVGGHPVYPEDFGYSTRHVPLELTAEAVRAYMLDPNYMKTVAPDLAEAIRAKVNSGNLRKTIQFNAVPIPVTPAQPE